MLQCLNSQELCDEVKTVREFTYLGGGCDASVTAITRLVYFMFLCVVCVLVYRQVSSNAEVDCLPDLFKASNSVGQVSVLSKRQGGESIDDREMY